MLAKIIAGLLAMSGVSCLLLVIPLGLYLMDRAFSEGNMLGVLIFMLMMVVAGLSMLCLAKQFNRPGQG